MAKDRAALEKFVAGLTGDLAVPTDREFGYEEVERHGRAATNAGTGQLARLPASTGGPA